MKDVTSGSPLGPRSRRAVRAVARVVNPLVLLVAGRRWMPIVGVLHHVGRRSGRLYSTPLGMRPDGDGFFIPRTFGDDADWYRNLLAAGACVVTYGGRDHLLVDPEVVDYAAAAAALPAYERIQFRLIGINQYLRMRALPAESAAVLPHAARTTYGSRTQRASHHGPVASARHEAAIRSVRTTARTGG